MQFDVNIMRRLFYLFLMICAYSVTYAQNLTMKAAEATILSGISDDSIKSNDFDSADLRHRQVIRHPFGPFYGVTVLHGWTSGNYHDEGYLFMLWDFTDKKAPQIHIRTWQPSMINGKPLPEDEIFGLQNFDI